MGARKVIRFILNFVKLIDQFSIEYYWDGTGNALVADIDDSCTATATASADGRDMNGVDASICGGSFEDDDLEEDTETTALFSGIQPPSQYQDLSVNRSLSENEEDYVSNPRVSKRFSDYVPVADLDSLMGDNGNYAEDGPVSSPLARMESDLDVSNEVDIPPPMQPLSDPVLRSERKYASEGGLSMTKELEEETASLLNGNSRYNFDTLPTKSGSVGYEWSNTSRPFSSLLGKQTQV